MISYPYEVVLKSTSRQSHSYFFKTVEEAWDFMDRMTSAHWSAELWKLTGKQWHCYKY